MAQSERIGQQRYSTHPGDQQCSMPVSNSGDADWGLTFSFLKLGIHKQYPIKACLRFFESGKGKWPSLDVELLILIPVMAGTIVDHERFTLSLFLRTECDKNRGGLQQCVTNPAT
jgi:hypothetical protein